MGQRLPVWERVTANGAARNHLKHSRPELRPDTLEFLAASLKKQWRRYRRELKACQKKFSPAGVHHSRVATRRLLALFALLAPFLAPARRQKIESALKRHLDLFDELRDSQVQLRAVRKLRGKFPAARRFHRFLGKREERVCRKTRKRVKAVRIAHLAKTVSGCRDKLRDCRKHSMAAGVNQKLLRVIDNSFARACDLRQRINPRDTRTIHCTRVVFKKFRYMVETLAEHTRWANRGLLEAMHDYQGRMGEIQDVAVLLQTFEKFACKKKIKPASADQVRQELLGRRSRLIQTYLESADQLLDFWPPWRSHGLQRDLVAQPPASNGLSLATALAAAAKPTGSSAVAGLN